MRYAAAGSWAPDPGALAAFATAAARRYSGRHPDPLHPGAVLPRVRLWQAWNEPNLARDLSPQWVVRGGRWVAWAPAHYRRMLNAFHDAVKGVDPAATVVTAGTAPDGDPRDGSGRMMPVRFWQAFFCLGAPPRLARAPCADPARFDVLAYHPLSIADPARPAPPLAGRGMTSIISQSAAICSGGVCRHSVRSSAPTSATRRRLRSGWPRSIRRSRRGRSASAR